MVAMIAAKQRFALSLLALAQGGVSVLAFVVACCLVAAMLLWVPSTPDLYSLWPVISSMYAIPWLVKEGKAWFWECVATFHRMLEVRILPAGAKSYFVLGL